MKEAAPKAIYLKDYSVPAFLVDTVDLHFSLNPGATTVTATMSMKRNPDSEHTGGVTLDGELLELKEVAIDGELLSAEQYQTDAETLTIADVPDAFELRTVVVIHPEDNTALEGLYQSSGNYCTQCEAQGFRKITYYFDRPDVMATFTTTVEGGKADYPVLLSNGNPIDKGEADDGRHWVKWEDPHRKPAYLFALVAGELTLSEGSFTTMSGREVALHIFTEKHNADKTDHAVRSLQRAMKWDEERFGLEYDLDIYMIVAVDDFNMGAMENKGLNVFNSKLVFALPETATDADYVAIEAVIAHEYFHNWTGNRVTCRDWFQLSLKEGLTVYRDEEFTADMTSAAVKRIDDVRGLRAHQFPEDASPMAHPIRPASFIEINNFYTMTVYEKGAEVVRLYETLLGKEGFRKGMDLYFQRHDGQAVTTEDFRAAMADANGVDLSLLQRWYEQAGTPTVNVVDVWNEQAKSYTLTLSQSCPPTSEKQEKEPFPLPIRMGLLGSEGNALPLRLEGEAVGSETEKVLLLTEREQSFTFVGLNERPIPSLLRGFSAPVHLKFPWKDEQLAFLMAKDTDSFNRWEAGQVLATNVLLGLVEDRVAGKELGMNAHLREAFRSLLQDDQTDPALLAEALTLPDSAYLAEQMEVIDVDGINAAREFVKTELARELKDLWLAVYQGNATPGEYAIDADSMGKRRLKNCALAYLTHLESEDSAALAVEQFEQAGNMTDGMAALRCLAHSGMSEKASALKAFEEKWSGDTLVMDKWFVVQATSPQSNVLAEVKQLLEHPLFSMTNPNKVRSVIGAFANANPLAFHNADGSGYEFVSSKIIELDGLNPQIASRLTKVFTRWRRYDDGRQALMKLALENIKAHPGLSPDVFEIVDRSLA